MRATTVDEAPAARRHGVHSRLHCRTSEPSDAFVIMIYSEFAFLMNNKRRQGCIPFVESRHGSSRTASTHYQNVARHRDLPSSNSRDHRGQTSSRSSRLIFCVDRIPGRSLDTLIFFRWLVENFCYLRDERNGQQSIEISFISSFIGRYRHLTNSIEAREKVDERIKKQGEEKKRDDHVTKVTKMSWNNTVVIIRMIYYCSNILQ